MEGLFKYDTNNKAIVTHFKDVKKKKASKPALSSITYSVCFSKNYRRFLKVKLTESKTGHYRKSYSKLVYRSFKFLRTNFFWATTHLLWRCDSQPVSIQVSIMRTTYHGLWFEITSFRLTTILKHYSWLAICASAIVEINPWKEIP